jgi:aminoglycoside phosphotransferase (APT) family kinase protein
VPQWTAEIAVGEPLARHLLREQFPSLETRSLRLLATGWDNTVWVVDERWAFRFPRREVAVPLVEREVAVLPHLAPLPPLAVPVPRFVGRPSDSYPWPFLGGELLPGRELGSVNLDGAGEIAIAEALARFLLALHSQEALSALPDPDLLLADPNGRADMAVRVHRTREVLAQLDERGLWRAPAEARPLLESAESLAPSETPALVHGDLHFRHVLVDRGRASGVIDWGDVCLADPSVDLQLVWSFLEGEARDAFVAGYGPIPEERLLRARVLALSLNGILALYGHDEGQPEIERAALAGLERTMRPWRRPRIGG